MNKPTNLRELADAIASNRVIVDLDASPKLLGDATYCQNGSGWDIAHSTAHLPEEQPEDRIKLQWIYRSNHNCETYITAGSLLTSRLQDGGQLHAHSPSHQKTQTLWIETRQKDGKSDGELALQFTPLHP